MVNPPAAQPGPAIHFSTETAVVNPPAAQPGPAIHFSTATAAVNQPDHRGSFKRHQKQCDVQGKEINVFVSIGK